MEGGWLRKECSISIGTPRSLRWRRPTLLTLFQVFQNLARGVAARKPIQARARMRARTAKVKSRDGCAVACPAEKRAHGEHLVEPEFAVKDVAAGQSVGLLEVERRDRLPRLDA